MEMSEELMSYLTPEERQGWEISQKAHEMVVALCKPHGSEGSREWIMSILARPDYDPDIVIESALRKGQSALVTVAEMRWKVQEIEVQRNALQQELNRIRPEFHWRVDADNRAEAAERKVADLERDGWVSVAERLPELSGDDICIRLKDGSELHHAVLQSDGDYWWQVKFFDPSMVTHWRPTGEAGGGR